MPPRAKGSELKDIDRSANAAAKSEAVAVIEQIAVTVKNKVKPLVIGFPFQACLRHSTEYPRVVRSHRGRGETLGRGLTPGRVPDLFALGPETPLNAGVRRRPASSNMKNERNKTHSALV